MKIAVAQNRPVAGDVEHNVARHLALAGVAASNGAELVVFPELSLTGYEPKRAAEMARLPDDACFDELQALCNDNKVSIGVGVPLKTAGLPRISTLLFRPGREPFWSIQRCICIPMKSHTSLRAPIRQV